VHLSTNSSRRASRLKYRL